MKKFNWDENEDKNVIAFFPRASGLTRTIMENIKGGDLVILPLTDVYTDVYTDRSITHTRISINGIKILNFDDDSERIYLIDRRCYQNIRKHIGYIFRGTFFKRIIIDDFFFFLDDLYFTDNIFSLVKSLGVNGNLICLSTCIDKTQFYTSQRNLYHLDFMKFDIIDYFDKISNEKNDLFTLPNNIFNI